MEKQFLKILSDEQLDKMIGALIDAQKEVANFRSVLILDENYTTCIEMAARIFEEIRIRNINNNKNDRHED